MQDDPQTAEQQRRRLNIPTAVDPRNLDPRKAIDPATLERLLHAQSAARAQAQAATTVVISTIVSLITSAFGFAAALAWNSAIQETLKKVNGLLALNLSPLKKQLLYAVIVTLIAIVAVVVLSRIARRWAKTSALDDAATPGSVL